MIHFLFSLSSALENDLIDEILLFCNEWSESCPWIFRVAWLKGFRSPWPVTCLQPWPVTCLQEDKDWTFMAHYGMRMYRKWSFLCIKCNIRMDLHLGSLGLLLESCLFMCCICIKHSLSYSSKRLEMMNGLKWFMYLDLYLSLINLPSMPFNLFWKWVSVGLV